MTAYALQKDIAEEIEKILDCMLLKDVKGNSAHIKAYVQNLPIRQQNISADENDTESVPDKEIPENMDIMQSEDESNGPDLDFEDDPYPYCIVKVDSGAMQQEAQEIQTILIFGIFDDDPKCQGYQVILNMIHKVAERFTKNPCLKDRYRLNSENGITWVLDDTEQFPYFFGAMYMTWNTFFVRLEGGKYD